jgi:hypothetical protein
MYDPILSELLQRGPRKINYLSATIHNEIINIISKCVKKSIFSDVRKIPFFSYKLIPHKTLENRIKWVK